MLKRMKVNDHEAVLVLLTATLLCLELVLPCGAMADTCTIDTLAGGHLGDGGNAAAAVVSGPTGMARDGAGNLYIAETDHHRVRKVDVNGVITNLAGTGLPGCKGNGGPASSATLDSPSDVAVDADGNVYIADTGNHMIRKVGTDGLISTVAGTTYACGMAGSIGGEYGGDGGPALLANLYKPQGVRTIRTEGNILYPVAMWKGRLAGAVGFGEFGITVTSA